MYIEVDPTLNHQRLVLSLSLLFSACPKLPVQEHKANTRTTPDLPQTNKSI